MSLKLTAALVLAGVSYHVEASSVAELRDTIVALTNTDTPAVNGTVIGVAADGAKAEAKAPTKAKKSAETEKPAATPSPAPETEKATATTASEAGQKSSSPTTSATNSAPAVTDYLKTGIPDKIAAYLGEKDAAGYADRRASVVALLTSFSVKKGPELKAEQFAEFESKLDAIVAPADDDIG